MAALPVTIVGIQTDEAGNSSNTTIIGMISITGLAVGGGPIIPPAGPGGPNVPPHPQHPIWGGPGTVFPPGSGYPPVAGHPFPEPPPTAPPENPDMPKPPPPDGGWGWHPEYGWGYFPGTGGEAQPHT